MKDRAYCDPCKWDGPWRDQESAARADLRKHIEKAHPKMNATKKSRAAKIAHTSFVGAFQVKR